LKKFKSSLKELLNVSSVDLVVSNVELVDVGPNRAGAVPMSNVDILNYQLNPLILPAEGHKCDRCWNYYADDGPQRVRQFGAWPNVCGRCAGALRQMGYSEDAK
jgi:hypothetical protein